MPTGVIVRYFSDRRFGFIKVEEQTDNVFFHRDESALSEDRIAYLMQMDVAIEFDQAEGPKGIQAKNIREASHGEKIPTLGRILAGTHIQQPPRADRGIRLATRSSRSRDGDPGQDELRELLGS